MRKDLGTKRGAARIDRKINLTKWLERVVAHDCGSTAPNYERTTDPSGGVAARHLGVAEVVHRYH